MATVPKRDALGDRMKRYENSYRFLLPRRTYVIVRIDGRAFHTWTRNLQKPYDKDFMTCMDAAAVAVCKDTSAKFAFVQSDEISVLLTDFEDIKTQAYFDGVLQKICSVTASVATMAFNLQLMKMKAAPGEVELPITKKHPTAVFDSRAFLIPDPVEVENYFIWRQQDASRNSVTLLASAYASHKQLHGKSTKERHEVIHAAGDNWAKHPTRFKHGGVIRKSTMDEWEVDLEPATDCYRDGNWFVDIATPVFTRNREYLTSLIPRHWSDDGVKQSDLPDLPKGHK
jgi:tRNA(His) 5'-end guanylyltransferase